MGQTIQILDSRAIDNVLLVATDRSLTGQDGESYTGPVSARAVDTFGAQLAVRLFEADPEIDHTYVMSNALSIRRRGGWNDERIGPALQEIAAFFRHYQRESLPVEAESEPPAD
jgi:hypothetical protein